MSSAPIVSGSKTAWLGKYTQPAMRAPRGMGSLHAVLGCCTSAPRFLLQLKEQAHGLERRDGVEVDTAQLPGNFIPGRVAEAKERIKQIDDLKEAQRKAEAQQAEMMRKMEELERLEKEMEAQQE